MNVAERARGDRKRLGKMISKEGNAKQRDRLRAVTMALDGRGKLAIVQALGRSKSFVEDWVYAYRDGGIEAIRPIKQTGRPTLLSKEREAAFLERVDAGPREDDGVCTLRGADLRRILHAEYDAPYSERGVYALMKRVGYSSLKPRPIHEKHDPLAAAAFRQSAPLLSKRRRPSGRASVCA